MRKGNSATLSKAAFEKHILAWLYESPNEHKIFGNYLNYFSIFNKENRHERFLQ